MLVDGGCMKIRAFRLVAVIVFGVASVITAWSALGSNQDATNRRVNEDDRFAQDPPRKTMRDVAQERDIDMTYEPESDVESDDLMAITRGADTIVLGKIIEAKSDFDRSGDFIETFYSVEVSRVLKANAPIYLPLKLFRPGGTVQVNGHIASVKVKGNEQLIAGQTYIFFLHWVSKHQVYALAGSFGGAFLVTDDFRVKSLSIEKRSLMKLNHDDTNLEAFINEVMRHQQ
jgi:hypothetical protein